MNIPSNPFVYQSVFGGANIYPSDISYSAITLSSNITLNWPLESAPAQDHYAAKIMDINCITGGATIFLPNATGAGVGETILFNNVTSDPLANFTVSNGSQVANVPPGATVQVYLADNSSAAGVWRNIPYGVGVSPAQAKTLAGYGLIADGFTLDTAIAVLAIDQNYTLDPSLRAQLINYTGSGGTIGLPDVTKAGANWYCIFRNSGSAFGQGQLVIAPTSTSTIDGLTNKTLNPGESCYVICDGSNWYSVGYGQNAVFVFDYTVIPLTGQTTPFTLAGNNLNRIGYEFNGVITQDFTIIVPLAKQQYWVYNNTSGSYNFYVKALGQSGLGVQVLQGQRNIIICDGSNAYHADSFNVPVPIPVLSGGTGATTKLGALSNLGGSYQIGIPVFTATTQADAQAALGIVDQTALTVGLVIALGG